MKKVTVVNLTCIALFAICIFSMCKKEDSYLKESDVLSILQKAGTVSPIAADKDEIIETTSEREDGFRYTYNTHDVIKNFESIGYLGMNDDVIWPGSLVKGNWFHDLDYDPILIDRAPMELKIIHKNVSPGSNDITSIDNPTQSTVEDGISELLEMTISNYTEVPSDIDFSYQEVCSQSQMNLILGTDILCGCGDLDTQFDWEETSANIRILATYKLKYYTIEVEKPDSPMGFFDPSLTKNELSAAIVPGSCPVYLSSVSYGMKAIMCIETPDYTYLQMEDALEASYEGDLDSDLGFGKTAREILESCTINIITYGGSAAGLDIIETGCAGYLKVIEAGTNFTNTTHGVPLEYKFCNLLDNTPAKLTILSQHTLMSIKKVGQIIKIQLEKFTVIGTPDDGKTVIADWPFFVDDVTLEIDRLNLKVNAFNKESPNADFVQFNPVDQEVYSYVTSSWTNMTKDDYYPETPPEPISLEFDMEDFDFQYAKIELKGEARDFDSVASDAETAIGDDAFIGYEMIGTHLIRLHHADFDFDVKVTITTENK